MMDKCTCHWKWKWKVKVAHFDDGGVYMSLKVRATFLRVVVSPCPPPPSPPLSPLDKGYAESVLKPGTLTYLWFHFILIIQTWWGGRPRSLSRDQSHKSNSYTFKKVKVKLTFIIHTLYLYTHFIPLRKVKMSFTQKVYKTCSCSSTCMTRTV